MHSPAVSRLRDPTPGIIGDEYWIPFTPNRAFRKSPRIIVGAKDMHYVADDGRRILDGTAGMWCTNAGHNRKPIVGAIQRQAAQLDYSPAFQFAHPAAFDLARRVAALAPEGLDRVFFCNSGSEAVDTALKIARAYQQNRGQTSRTRFIGRDRGYHGMGFGGLSVGGIPFQKKGFGPLLADVAHLKSTYDREHQAFSKGEPEWGLHLADDLLTLIEQHGPSTIAAVIVEPVAGSTGVLPPPRGYLKRLRSICDQFGILLVFDEVITGFGRLGHPFAAQRYDVIPDVLVFAKGITSGTVPMGGVAVHGRVYDAFAAGPEHAIELAHGYTYSAHPLACAAALATLALYDEERLFERARRLEPLWIEQALTLKDCAGVLDVRAVGLMAGIDLDSRVKDGRSAQSIMQKAFAEHGLLVRGAGSTLMLSPPLIITEDQIEQIFATLRGLITAECRGAG